MKLRSLYILSIVGLLLVIVVQIGGMSFPDLARRFFFL